MAASGAAALQTAVRCEAADVVISPSRVGSATLQADGAEQKPECLLRSTEAISSSRLYSKTQTQNAERKREDKGLRDDR